MLESPKLSDKLPSGSREAIDEDGIRFLDFASSAVERLMPHVRAQWGIEPVGVSRRRPTSSFIVNEDGIGTLMVSFSSLGFTVSARVSRRTTDRSFDNEIVPLSCGEELVCKIVAERLARTLRKPRERDSESLSLRAISSLLDEQIVSEWITQSYPVRFSVLQTIAELRRLAEQTYENKSIAFGCVIDCNQVANTGYRSVFPEFLAEFKRYRALSDGFRTAYVVSADGCIADFCDMHDRRRKMLPAENYPLWAEHLVQECRNRRVFSMALTRNGDVLVLGKQGLVWAYRFGKWQLWEHDHVMHMLHQACRGQRVASSVVEEVTRRLYLSAMDVSFRRTGGLFVLLASRRRIAEIVRERDRLRPRLRTQAERQFDLLVGGRAIQELPRGVLADLAGLDGAIVVDKRGRILAYGAVLKTPTDKADEMAQVEGSRTRAARSASYLGVAIKASSDGDVSIWSKGSIILQV